MALTASSHNYYSVFTKHVYYNYFMDFKYGYYLNA